MSHKARVVCAMAVVVRELTKRKKQEEEEKVKKKRSRLWVKEFREDRFFSYDETENDIPHTFMQVLGIDEAVFNSLLEKIANKIYKTNTVMRQAIPAKLKLQVFLEYIATGCTITSLAGLFHVSSSSMSKFIPEVATEICESLKEYIQTPTDENGWKSIADGFQEKYGEGAKNCVGVLQGKTITSKQWIRYGKDSAIYFWFVADTNHNVLCVDAGTCLKDGLPFAQSNLAKSLENNSICLPEDYFFIGPSTVELGKHVMTPFMGLGVECLLPESEDIYNAKLERISKTADNTFNLIRSRFKIFDNPVTLAPDSVVKLINATCVLHNWMQKVAKTENVEFPGISGGDEDVELPGISPAPGTGSSNAPGMFNLNSIDDCNVEAIDRRYSLAKIFNNDVSHDEQHFLIDTV